MASVFSKTSFVASHEEKLKGLNRISKLAYRALYKNKSPEIAGFSELKFLLINRHTISFNFIFRVSLWWGIVVGNDKADPLKA